MVSAIAGRRTVLYDRHRSLGAKVVEFGGWDMPVSYPSGTIAEHRACRSSAVAFDVSHLGTVRVSGPGAFSALQRSFTNDLDRIGVGRAQYTHLLDPVDASVLDDIIVWWVGRDSFDVMPNASNTDRVVEALRASGDGFICTDVTDDRGVIALQGPSSRALLATFAPSAAAVGRIRVISFDFAGVQCTVAGTGYTGEDGVECAVPVAVAVDFWDAAIAAGFAPAGLGARDTLRLEAALPLHGHELGPGITSRQAGLGWAVSANKGDFRGRQAFEAETAAGVARRLVGISLEGRQPARDGATVHLPGHLQPVGVVSSGNFSPTLDHAIALAFVDTIISLTPGDAVECDVRGRRLVGAVTALPFVAKHGSREG